MTNINELSGDHVFPIPVAGQGTAGTADEFGGMVAPFGLRITAVKWIPAAAVTANDTNYFTLTLRNRGQDGAGAALAAQRSYAATDSVAFKAEAMTLSGTDSDLEVAAGDVLTIGRVISGTGLAMPDGVVQIHAQAA